MRCTKLDLRRQTRVSIGTVWGHKQQNSEIKRTYSLILRSFYSSFFYIFNKKRCTAGKLGVEKAEANNI